MIVVVVVNFVEAAAGVGVVVNFAVDVVIVVLLL